MVFAPALQPFLERRPDALDVLEIEPQTLWLADDPFAGPFREFGPAIDMLAALPQRKLVHSVGMPIGGTRAPHPGQMALIGATARRLGSPWVSEHLSIAGTPHRAAGFLLPPLQTEEGVALAARNIRRFARGTGSPVAIETGVAYFARKPFEMPDGAFVARIAEAADCGILLDLHNIWCNERNGRISMDAFLADLPLDRVWEVHLAGGTERDGVWLDSHSGEMPDALAGRAREIVQDLPSLGAINFEIYDTFLSDLEPAVFDRVVDGMRRTWEMAGRAASDAPPAAAVSVPPPPAAAKPAAHPAAPAAADWERAVTEAVWKAEPDRLPDPADAAPARLYAALARSFRGSMLARSLPRTIRYLILRDGAGIDATLAAYYAACDPRLYAPLECAAFAGWLRPRERDPLLRALLDYDMALVEMAGAPAPRVVRFPGDPVPVFEALAEGRLPAPPPPPAVEIEILPDAALAEGFAPA